MISFIQHSTLNVRFLTFTKIVINRLEIETTCFKRLRIDRCFTFFLYNVRLLTDSRKIYGEIVRLLSECLFISSSPLYISLRFIFFSRLGRNSLSLTTPFPFLFCHNRRNIFSLNCKRLQFNYLHFIMHTLIVASNILNQSYTMKKRSNYFLPRKQSLRFHFLAEHFW